MRNITRHTAAALLLFIMALPICYSLSMEWRRHYIRREMKENLQQGMLSSITLSENEINWYKPGKEILVNGHLFDVESQVKIENGRIRFTGLYDVRETALNNLLDKHQKEQDQKNCSQFAKLFNDWQAIPLTTEEQIDLHTGTQNFFNYKSPVPSSAFTSILKPPPQA